MRIAAYILPLPIVALMAGVVPSRDTTTSVLSLQRSPSARPSATNDPTEFRRLEFRDLRYAGAFRLPDGEANGNYFSYGGATMAFNPELNTLFISTLGSQIAEVTIPNLVTANAIEDLPFAEYRQPFVDPTEGRIEEVAASGAVLAGLLVHERRLYGSAVIYYDANNTQTVSHFSRSLFLGEKSATPMRRVGERGRVGFVAGYMAPVPAEWRALLGGPALTGQCCISIVSRTSYGPAASAWDPGDLARGDAPSTALVQYDSAHTTLGPWNGSGPVYGGTTSVGGLALIDGTRTALFLGSNGTGPFCYGPGTYDMALAGTPAPEGESYCYDPSSADKGQHAYPYRSQIWAYDLNDWADVRAGRKQPWEVTPYGVWPFDLPFPEPGARIGGVAYDPVRRLLYFAQMRADRGGYAYRAVMHAYYIL